jgi:hypothetical protein
MLSSIINDDTREELKLTLDGIMFPIKMYCIILMIFISVIIFQFYFLIKSQKY